MISFSKIITLILSIFNLVSTYNSFGQPSINISPENLKKHVNILGNDLFEGRGTGTRGGELAANYIQSVFKNIGLIPIGDNDSYYQSVPMHGANVLPGSKLYIYLEHDTLELKIGSDYLLANSGEQTIVPQAIEMVFVGFGIIAPEYDHNDYLNRDIGGKIAVMINGEPESYTQDYFNGDEPTIFSYPDIKHRLAISRGAAGTIIIPQFDLNDVKCWEDMGTEYSFEDINLSYNASNSFSIIISPKTVRKLFENINASYQKLSNYESLNFKKCFLKFDGKFFVRDFKSYNVVGMIKGNNSSNEEYLLISAHYDHLGIGSNKNGDNIYNGVLDNAIGVSALLEVARDIKNKEAELRRSIIFIATTGEEKGLLGATYYTDNPIVPLYKTVANINIDGIAYLDNFLSIIGIGGELSELGENLTTTAGNYGVTIAEIPKEFYSYEAFNRSDQIAFAKAGIPSILILDSPEYVNLTREEAINRIIYYNQEIYHTPLDDLTIDIDYNAATKHTSIISSYISDLAISNKVINWKKNVQYNFIRLQTKAEKR